MAAEPVLRITGVTKRYQGVRPLRIRELTLAPGDRVALSGFDAGAAEVLVNLVTGASVPDEGEVAVLGRTTTSISDGDEWLSTLDSFGIVSPRAVLLDSATLLQNLAMPFSLEIEPVPPSVLQQVLPLAREAGIDNDVLSRPIAALTPGLRMRAHLARAVALAPALLILEHPTAQLPPEDRRPFGEAVERLASRRSLTTLIISEDREFTTAAKAPRLKLHGGTGELKKSWWG